MEDAVDVIWHNDKRIERQVSKTCRQLLPRFYKYVTEFRPIEKWLALPGTDGHEIGAWLAVVIPFQTDRMAMMLFRIISHRFISPLRLEFAFHHSISFDLVDF